MIDVAPKLPRDPDTESPPLYFWIGVAVFIALLGMFIRAQSETPTESPNQVALMRDCDVQEKALTFVTEVKHSPMETSYDPSSYRTVIVEGEEVSTLYWVDPKSNIGYSVFQPSGPLTTENVHAKCGVEVPR